MKICVIAPVVIPLLGRNQRYGGIEVVISTIIEELTRIGHEVIVFASGDSNIEAKLIPTIEISLGLGISFEKEIECNKLAYQMAIAERPDVIWDNTLALHTHTQATSEPEMPLGSNAELRLNAVMDTGNIPVVHTLHGPTKGHLTTIAQKLSQAGHYFVTISRDQSIGYLGYISLGQHLGTIYNPVDLDFYKPSEKKSNNFLLWIGRFGMEKGPHIALQVAHAINYPIVLIGKKSEPHEEAYFNEFIASQLRDSDLYLDQPTPDLKAEMLRNARTTLMTNLWSEPFGMVLAESMASGTPVIGPAKGSLTELIEFAGVLIKVDDLGLTEDVLEVDDAQHEYILRIIRQINDVDRIPSSVPRKRAEFLFSPKTAAKGYEEAFLKAIYLKKIV